LHEELKYGEKYFASEARGILRQDEKRLQMEMRKKKKDE
jgi:hypothetical protein